MKKVIIGDFCEYNYEFGKLGNYHYCNCFVNDGYEALWLSNAFNQLIYFKDKQDYLFKKSISSPKRHELSKNIFGYAPYTVRLYGNYPFFRNSNAVLNGEKFIFPNIKKSLSAMDFGEVDILWLSNPKLFWIANVVKYKKLIYRIPDDFSAFSEYPNINILEKEIIKRADHIFITSSTLSEKATQLGKTPYLLKNGASFDHFSNPKDDKFPAEFNNGRKRIIYIGTIKYWFDVDLVKKIAQSVDADIILIGKPDTDLSSIENLENVYILGAKSYNELPAYLKHSDVAIIPFIKSELTDSISPIKLYEYCSSGIAVVTSNLKEVESLNAPIYIAKSHDDFISGIKSYLSNKYNKSEIMQFGKENSWQSRYEFAKSLICE